MKLGELRELSDIVSEKGSARTPKNGNERLWAMGVDPNTVYQELEMTSPYVDIHRDSSDSGSHVNLHSHMFYEVIYCCNSCGAEYLVGPERYRLQRGDLIFIPPGTSHMPMLPEKMSEPYRRYILWLSPEFMEKYARLLPYPITEKQAQASMLRTGGTQWENLEELFLAGVTEAEQQADGWEAAVIGNTILLLTRIKRATDAQWALRLKAEKPELLTRIMSYVEENYAAPITIGEISRRFFVSSSTVSHLFQQKLGVSFYRYVTQRRLIAAKTLIGRGQSLEAVAAQTGFRDYSGFYRAFRQEYGISPRQYRSIQEAVDRTPNRRE